MPKTHRVLSRAQGLLVEEMGWGGCWFLQEGWTPYLTPHISIILVIRNFVIRKKTGIFHLYIFLGSFQKWYFFVSFRRFGIIRFSKIKMTEKWKHPTLPGHYRLEMLDGMGFLFRLHGMTKHGQLQAFESYAKNRGKVEAKVMFEWDKVVHWSLLLNTPHCLLIVNYS